ncbi:MAG: methylmalonyl Co-A mutase-associated GTPase MeaB [Alphaproteobacteria bacterium]|nr:methylmalonyl Co-A mutase-associated GTPase MeaB [Alphaproteobacteria bacterium]
MAIRLDKAADLATAVRRGDRRALARAITAAESSRPEHRQLAEAVLSAVVPHRGASFRLGISGAPGAGKSTFIEAFGLHLLGAGRRVAVLAVDPSSALSGGAILGDKTRMPRLARAADAYIRPSAAGLTLGGVARRTREAILLVEAAGFDIVLVETVGVGQSETAVADMVDMFLLLLPPAAGDELQGVKRGIIELADLVVVTKSDGALLAAANHAASDYRSALSLLRPRLPPWQPEVVPVSALEGRGLDLVWVAAQRFQALLQAGGLLQSRRAEQARRWLWSELEQGLIEALRARADLRQRACDLEAEVVAGRRAATLAARELLERFLSG